MRVIGALGILAALLVMVGLAMAGPALAGQSAAPSKAPPPGTGQRFEIPIRTIILPYGDLRYSIPIIIGGTTVNAMLDTGSPGLRILARALPAAAITGKSGPVQTVAYGAGDVLAGPVVRFDAKFGPATPVTTIPAQIVIAYQCTASHPNCPASLLHPEEYKIGGERVDGFGYDAIIGVEMPQPGAHPQPVPNPLTVFARRWIVTLPMPDDDTSGKIIVNPSTEELRGFTLYPLDPKLKDTYNTLDDAIMACLKVGNLQQFCAPTTLDSGAPAFMAYSDNVVRPGFFQDASPVELTFVNPHGVPDSFRFAASPYPASRVLILPLPQGQPNHIAAGLLPFQYYSVLYDMDDNAIGLRPRVKS
ncbi:MAG TPA: hypothetical protein VL574_06835 [Stellaceae bacterium]|nr:hypothetical protein [Stellaceae bacterium]